jgi:hypothetical protein
VAIRPVDLQGAIFQQTQISGVAQQAQEAARVAQTAAQTQFVNELEHREETVQESDAMAGNRVNPGGEKGGGNAQYRRRERKPGEALPEDAVELAEYSDGEHIIDFTA